MASATLRQETQGGPRCKDGTGHSGSALPTVPVPSVCPLAQTPRVLELHPRGLVTPSSKAGVSQPAFSSHWGDSEHVC